MNVADHPPVVLAIGGHDPSGGAGLVADVQTLSQLGCHPVTLISALTLQDLTTVHEFYCVDPALIQQQCELLLRTLPVCMVKIGMLGSAATVTGLAPLLRQAGLPLVLDPVLTAGDGSALATDDLAQSLRTQLLPFTTVATPNTREALALTGTDDIASAAQQLLNSGCAHVLITGTDANAGNEIAHRLYTARAPAAPQVLTCARLPGSFHGSGCTLASAIAAYLAHGDSAGDAVGKAQTFTYHSLANALYFNQGQMIPDRTLPR